jgi:hypothetical protein
LTLVIVQRPSALKNVIMQVLLMANVHGRSP